MHEEHSDDRYDERWPSGEPYMRRVVQANDFDCGVACLEMVTGLGRADLEERLGYLCAETRLPELPYGVLSEETVMILHALGRRPLFVRSRDDIEDEARIFAPGTVQAAIPATMARRRLLLDHDSILDLAFGHQAILSMRLIGGTHHHAVAWDRWRLIDPAPSRTVEHDCFETWRITSAVIAMA